MALVLITNPPSLLVTDTDWTNFVTRENKSNIGTGLSIPIFTLTNWDGSTTIPAIAEGSIIEVGGSLYQADADTALTPEGGIIDGTVHIKLVPGAGSPDPLTVVPTLTNDVIPAWDAVKGGWYDSTDKFLPFEITKASAIYTNKGEFIDQNKLISIHSDGAFTISGKMKWKYYYKANSSPTENDVFDSIQSWVPNVGDGMSLIGQGIGGQITGTDMKTLYTLLRISITEITILGAGVSIIAANGDPTIFAAAIELMSNFDALT